MFLAITFLLNPQKVSAFSIESYLTYPSQLPIAVGYSYGDSHINYSAVTYADGYSTSRYVIYRNAVKQNIKYYDLIIYPYASTSVAQTMVDQRLIASIICAKSGYSGHGAYKLVVTEHVENGIGNAVNFEGMIGFSDLDYAEYVIVPNQINANDYLSHVGRNVSLSYTGYGYKYRGETESSTNEESYDYNAIFFKTKIPASGLTVYYGTDNGTVRACWLCFDPFKSYIEQTWPKYNVTYIDVVESVDGKVLGQYTRQEGLKDTVRGFNIGSDTSDNAYYKNYYLDSDTSAVVTGDGIRVYRIFKQCLQDIEGTIYWVDKDDKLGMRPKEVTIKLFQDGMLFDEVVVDGSNEKDTHLKISLFMTKRQVQNLNIQQKNILRQNTSQIMKQKILIR